MNVQDSNNMEDFGELKKKKVEITRKVNVSTSNVTARNLDIT